MREYHGFQQKFFITQCRKFSWGNPSEFPYFRVSKIFMTMRGISRFSMENLLPHSTEKLRRRTLLCFTKIPVAETFNDKRGGGWNGVSSFSVEIFLSHTV